MMTLDDIRRVPTARLPDWTSRLAAVLAAARRRPYQDGAHDCCTLAASACFATTGVDPLEALRQADGRLPWTDADSSARTLEELGGLEAVAAQAFGARIEPAFAQRGDIALAGECFAIVDADGLLAPGARGLVRVAADRVTAAWPVGRVPGA